MSRIISIISGKGGVGKTTLTANLGVALAKFGKRVVAVDCNLTTSHLGFYFGLYYYSKTLNHVLKGEAAVSDTIYNFYPNFSIIPASLSLEDLVGVEISQLKPSLDELSSKNDIILLDSAPGIGREALSVLTISKEAIFVATPNIPSIADVMKCSKLVKELEVEPIGIVLNMVKKNSTELSETEVEELTNLPILAKIPYDKNVEKSLKLGLPLIYVKPYSPASVEITNLAALLLGEKPLKKGFFHRIISTFRSAINF
ncbi:MAG: cell division ATPase MinD [Candidatus Aenigmatarchaeota archaeon]